MDYHTHYKPELRDKPYHGVGIEEAFDVYDAINILTARQREAIVLLSFGETTVTIAASLGICPRAARNLIRRGLKNLQTNGLHLRISRPPV